MAWLASNNVQPSDRLSNQMLNNLANDDRVWGGDVNAGGYKLSNVILTGSGGFTSTTSPINVTAGSDGTSAVNLMKDVTHSRWSIVKGSGAESGGNAGSNFFINRFDDSGALIDSPICIVRSSGYVGIGTSNPGSRFVISNPAGGGGLEFSPAVNWSGTNGTYITSYDRVATAYRDVIFDLNGAASSAFTMKAGGNIGIGNATPQVRLAVTGPSGVYNGSGTEGIAQFTTGTGGVGDDKLQFGVVTGSYAWIQAVKPGSAVRPLILNPSGGTGYVGVGTTTPQINLAVTGASSAYANSNGGIFMVTTGSGGGADERMEFGILDGNYVWVQGTKPGSAARPIVLNPVGGNVGVGGVPGYDFHVVRASAYTQIMLENTSGTGDSGYLVKDANRTWKLGINIAAVGAGIFSIFDATASVQRLTIQTNGNVSLGAVLGTHLLELAADSAAKPGTNTWSAPSDIRLKRNIRRFEGDIELFRRLDPIEAEYNGKLNLPEGMRIVGFNAAELRKILPQAVSSVRGKLNQDDVEETDILSVNTHEVFFHMLRAVQILDKRLSELES